METIKMKQNGSFAILVFFVILGVGAALAYARYKVGNNAEAVGNGVVSFILAFVAASAIQIADQWKRAVILRLVSSTLLEGRGCFSSFRSSMRFLIGSISEHASNDVLTERHENAPTSPPTCQVN
jgi:hypothetical protein